MFDEILKKVAKWKVYYELDELEVSVEYTKVFQGLVFRGRKGNYGNRFMLSVDKIINFKLNSDILVDSAVKHYFEGFLKINESD